MANQMKEDEKNEKVIRGLLKLPANRRCINCNSLGPQYVCINFWTFVCTNCSGVHREFTHRVKSISMAKFTTNEVNALQEGGNEHAKEIYFKQWDHLRHSLPDSSNIQRLRDFIKHVYLDKKYTSEKSADKNLTMRMGNKTVTCESKDTYQSGSRSPHCENTCEHHLAERFNSKNQNDDKKQNYNYDGRGSPRYNQNIRHGHRKNPVRFEVVDDRYRDDTFGKGRRSEVRKFPNGEHKLGIKSPNAQKDLDMSRPPVMRSVKDIFGEDGPPLLVIESPKANGSKTTDEFSQLQRRASSSSIQSTGEKSIVLKKENLGSLINFDVDPAPAFESTELPAQPKVAPASQSVNYNPNDSHSSGKTPSNSYTLESLLFQLTTPEPLLSTNIVQVSTPKKIPNNIGESSGFPNNKPKNISLEENEERTLTIKLPETSSQVSPYTSQAPSLFDVAIDSQPVSSKSDPSIGWAPSSQHWNATLPKNALGISTIPSRPSQVASKPIEDTSGDEIESKSRSMQTKHGERKELPEDLFTATYSSVSVPAPTWYSGRIVQYPSQEAQPNATTFHQSKSKNPFDLNDEPTLTHAPMKSSMAVPQGALPNTEAHRGLLRTSSSGHVIMPSLSPSYEAASPSSSYRATQLSPSYGAASQQPSSYASTFSPNAFMGVQQVHNNLQTYGHQGFGSNGDHEESFFMTLNKQQQPSAIRSSLSASNSFTSLGGNPFG